MSHLFKKISIFLILIIIPVAMFGCGGGSSGGPGGSGGSGGNGDNYTYTKLQPAGEQIVKDTQLVFESIEEIAKKHNTQESLGNFAGKMQSVTRMFFICIDAIHLAIENDFIIAEDDEIDFGYEDEERGFIDLELNLIKPGDENEYNFTINDTDDKLKYTFNAEFGEKSSITNLYESITISDIELLADPDGMTLESDTPIVYDETDNNKLKITGDGDLVYDFGEYGKITLSLDEIKLGQPNEEEVRAGFEGKIYDDNITVDGSVYVAYNVDNSHPNQCVISGKINDKETDLFFNGKMDLIIRNTDFNPDGDEAFYSEDNWPQATISFEGGLGKANGNMVELKLKAEELAEFGDYRVDVDYKVVHTDKVSNISMRIENETPLPADEPKVNFVIKSDWGPAEIKMQLAYDNEIEKITDASGDVYAHGKKVADITLENGLIVVKYEDGHKETF